MSNANRDYAIVYDIKNSSLVLSRPLKFYITDQNTSNIFVRLVTKVSVGDGIDQYTDIEEASSYALTMRVIKPNNEVKSIEATQHEPESIFQFDLTEDFKDIPGKYICELTISTIVSERQELITSDPFNYEVKRSILSNVSEIIETEDTTVEKLLNNLEASKTRLFNDLELAKTNLHNDLNATSSALNLQVQASDNKIENIKGELSSRLDATGAELSSQIENNMQLCKINNIIERKFKPDVATHFDLNPSGNSVLTKSQIDEKLNKCKKCGMKSVIIQPWMKWHDSTSTLTLISDLETLKYMENKCLEMDLNVACLKLHMYSIDLNNVTDIISFQNQYKSIVNSLCEKFKDRSFNKFIPLNECKLFYKKGTQYVDFTNEVLNIVKNNGFECSISTEGGNAMICMDETIINNLDFFAINTYPRLSYKMEKTTLEDCIYAWNNCFELYCFKEMKRRFPNKKIIMSETGCGDYWIALANPGNWRTSSEWVKTNGLAPSLMLEGLFNSEFNLNLIDEVWWYYDSPIFNDVCKNVIERYTGGKNEL